MQVQTLEAGNTDIRDTDLQELRTAFRGQLIEPRDAAFDEARRVWNGMIDRRPAPIAQCSGAADVIAAVTFAVRHNLVVAVRGGGHSIPGHSNVAIIGLCYAGSSEAGENVVAPVRALKPTVDIIGPMPYTVLQAMFDPMLPQGTRAYIKSDFPLRQLRTSAAAFPPKRSGNPLFAGYLDRDALRVYWKNDGSAARSRVRGCAARVGPPDTGMGCRLWIVGAQADQRTLFACQVVVVASRNGDSGVADTRQVAAHARR
jgi:hypothetical protein